VAQRSIEFFDGRFGRQIAARGFAARKPAA
jgi:hypothetical protein